MGRKKKPIQPQSWELIVEDAASEGFGVARNEGKVVMVEGALPGDRVIAQETRSRRRFTEAKIVRLIEASPDRKSPDCEHFGSCGGCRLQHANYDAQLRYKQKQVTDALLRIGKLEIGESRPILGAEETYAYRNKLEFSFSSRRWLTAEEIESGEDFSRSALGFHVPRFFDKIVDIRRCLLQDERSNLARNAVRDYGLENGLSFYDIRGNAGLLRTLVIRYAFNTADFMLILITGEDDEASVNSLFEALAPELPFVTEWIWMHNPKANDSYADLPHRVLRGKGYIEELLGERRYRIGPVSFFQTNPLQAKLLYDQTRQGLENGNALLYDLYCGTGSIGIYCADLAERVVGVDYVESSIADARVNADINGLTHLRFEAGNLAKMFDEGFTSRHGKPDAVVVDPPRAGMDQPVVEQLLRLAPQRLVYVSCNPATQARDLALLGEAYEIRWIQPVDMFPQTLHVENVACLRRKN